jgi:hypothetical protein
MPDVTKQRWTAEELRKVRKASEEMGDIEFEMGMAPYTNYTGPIDAKNANYVGTPSGIDKLTLAGFVGQGTDDIVRQGRIQGQDIVIKDAPKDSINAVGGNATSATYAHENTHLKNKDMQEADVRLMDGATAQNEQDWEGAIETWQDMLHRQYKKRSFTRSEAERSMLDTLDNGGRFFSNKNNTILDDQFGKEFDAGGHTLPDDDRETYIEKRKNNSFWRRRLDELEEFDSWNEGLEERNKERTSGT